MIYKTIPGKKISQAGQKTGKVLVKIIFTQTHVTVLIKKLDNLSFKMFIKRETRARKTYVLKILLSFKTSGT